MRDRMRYVNHLNEIFDFGSANVLINENDFRNYKWTYNTQYEKITSFEKRIKNQMLTVQIVGRNSRTIANKLFEIIEKDVLTNQAGRMYVGDYYLTGYFYASNKKDYTQGTTLKIELSFVSDQAYWIKETPYIFRIDDEGTGGDEKGLGYDYGYPYDFSSPISSQNLVNTSFVPANFILNVYGQVVDPQIIIGGNIYQVNVTLGSNAILSINSKDKTVIVTDSKGVKTSAFANRNPEHYIFEKIKTGSLRVFCTPECNFDVVLLEERSEPIWI